jgi:nucleotide sugar dehydrogenase
LNVTVFGLGKIGLPLATLYASKGHLVTGVDLNESVIDHVNNSEVPFPNEVGLPDLLKMVTTNGSLTATSDADKSVKSAHVIVIAVPLYIDSSKNPDFGALDSVTELIASNIQIETLVIYETTLPVGTTRNRFANRIESKSGLVPGKDFFIAFSPERVSSGHVLEDIRKYPKIVGGLSDECTRRATDFYNSVIDFQKRPDLVKPNGVWEVSSPEAAEFVKLAETTYRDVNIALANQYSKDAQKLGLDIFDIIACANSQSYSHIHSPGISVGGHCIPVYPWLYMKSLGVNPLIHEARKVNDEITNFYLEKLSARVPLNGQSVVIYGLAYREGVKESAFSGAFTLKKLLEEQGSKVYLIDELYEASEILSFGFTSPPEDLKQFSLVIHTADNNLDDFIAKFKDQILFVIEGRENRSIASMILKERYIGI